MGQTVHFVVPLARWSAWPPALASTLRPPDVRFVDASLRRRLGPLARMLLQVANDCAGEVRPLRTVFASRHGELGYTVSLLEALAAGEPLSPTLFGLSVHNAPAGLFSTFRRDSGSSTALAAGSETLGAALLEAYCQLSTDPDSPVLVVYGDEPLPNEYREFGQAQDLRQQGSVLALLLAPGASRSTVVRAEAAADEAASDESQVESFVAHLESGCPGRWVRDGTAWTWH